MPELTDKQTFSDDDALEFHSDPIPGKISMAPTKPMATQRDLSLAYSPGVAVPVLAIAADADKAYDYTSKGNMVAVISNGTAILGLGNLGHMASKPVMEGKSVLFKRFADVDSFDVEVKTTDPDEFVTVVKNIGDTWGGINLEDIKSPECFEIEAQLQDLLDIPVFHDDQHGTAIISTAGLINAAHIVGKKLEDLKVVLSGAGAAGLSSIALMKAAGVKAENTVICDRQGVIYKGRDNVSQWQAAHATDTPLRTLEEAMVGADVVLGLSAKGAISKEMVASMAPKPIIFAMANPDPEITPEDVKSVRSDAIIATGRSDYVNQVNNVLAFPYLFRGALDVRARQINHEMKIACAHALAALAREDVPDEVAAAYRGRKLKFGPEYIIPTPFDPRLIWYIPPFIAQTAMETGVARKPIADMDAYRISLKQRVDPSAALMQKISSAVRSGPKQRVVFAEGEEQSVIRAAWAFKQAELGTPILVGREDLIRQNAAEAGLNFDELGIEIVNARTSGHNVEYTDWLYERLNRRGYLRRDVQRMINQDRNYFGATMIARGQADCMVTGVTRNFNMALKEVRRVLDVTDRMIGLSILLAKGRTLFVADTSIHELPNAAELAEIAIKAAATVKKLGRTPRVAFLSYSTFGDPPGDRGEKVREAIRILDSMDVGFEYEGEMPPELALNPEARANYPFMRLTGDANVLVMPAIHSAAISTRLVQSLGGATVIGPLLVGLEKSVQIVPLGASVNEIITAATFAAYAEGASVED
ncbi:MULTISPECIES: NADP-dependent malic enzyme [unclassified Brevundimonas]|uniref:NADP-dependent malic enzyme n=1 Tax=unclassified Brevundimonas TaxID=2622653 RepID=UPI000CFC920E|nr:MULTISPECIES: NADP-dependent malic enzyme [unclassified Brevundimonas]PRA36620.1 NADP-dependent malic enzyme [Brevundimonas sp. MYb27]PQZ78469.1 NADP-dependent malic enzyme [Brevundimonas sp. MYb31]PRB13520.1 NADP-dependent malic enzyme [Brevundimonas sp. MYb52]PRB34264.1 NADP-dependent malic enzyme [Brevundimonas sp. MYb46]PRB43141.1 NADP-dependent malic enzyme [Brevundimonas sp. MYb33]